MEREFQTSVIRDSTDISFAFSFFRIFISVYNAIAEDLDGRPRYSTKSHPKPPSSLGIKLRMRLIDALSTIFESTLTSHVTSFTRGWRQSLTNRQWNVITPNFGPSLSFAISLQLIFSWAMSNAPWKIYPPAKDSAAHHGICPAGSKHVKFVTYNILQGCLIKIGRLWATEWHERRDRKCAGTGSGCWYLLGL